ncbi:MAG: glycosyltransferase family 39 protein [Saprospiraceae bacterium]|nr:glycosyltransferase family 39 protein [Saprospiraceae bacterium]
MTDGKHTQTLKYQWAIAILGFVLFVPFLGTVNLFDWDEINFAECAREMVVTDNYFSVSINYQPFWEKPPLFIWMQAISMKMFGVNAFAARLPNAICGIITLLFLFNIGQRVYDKRFGLLWVMTYVGSLLPNFYFKSGIIDPWFNVLIFGGIVYVILFLQAKQYKNLYYSGVLIGLAVLTKGPVAILIFGLCVSVFWLMGYCKPIMTWRQLLWLSSIIIITGGLWFLMLFLSGHNEIISEFFLYQVRLFQTEDAGHGGPFFYHWLVLLIGCFPASVFALYGFKRAETDSDFQRLFAVWMKILFWVVLIVFSIVKTKIIHYSSLCYFPLTFLGTWYIHKLWIGEKSWRRETNLFLVVLAFLWALVLMALPLIDRYKTDLIHSGLIKDVFALENLKANVVWNGWEWLIGLFLILGILSILMLRKRIGTNNSILSIFLLTLFVFSMASVTIIPRVEQYSQGAAISFYKSLKDEDCYIETIGFKSYAHLFYSDKKPLINPRSYDKNWLLTGNIDKPAYFVGKINTVENVKRDFPLLTEIRRTNGFVFYKREVGK